MAVISKQLGPLGFCLLVVVQPRAASSGLPSGGSPFPGPSVKLTATVLGPYFIHGSFPCFLEAQLCLPSQGRVCVGRIPRCPHFTPK